MKTQTTDLLGREEMNLAEFPLGFISERVPSGFKAKTLTFEGQYGCLVVTGSDAYGLPTALDTDVIVGLMALTKIKNNFTDPVVPFSRYELLQILGRQDKGQSYNRIDLSLNRWMGVTLFYQRSFWDNHIKCRVDAKFHILESVLVYDHDVKKSIRSRHQDVPVSTFSWNRIFFASCQANNLKKLDLGVYFNLRSAVSKQLYRFLDKRFYLRPNLSFDLRELGFGHVGLSRNYSDSKLKEKLGPALVELESIGFLRPMTNAERYSKSRQGNWQIRLVCGKSLGKLEKEEFTTPGPLFSKPEFPTESSP